MDIAQVEYVVNRHNVKIPVLFDTITERNEDLISNPRYGRPLNLNASSITLEVAKRFRNAMTTRELDMETASICIDLSSVNEDYELLATRINISDLHKRTLMAMPITNRLSEEYKEILSFAADRIANEINFDKDYNLTYFGYQTLARSYLLRSNNSPRVASLLDNSIIERPQHLFMRIALSIFGKDLDQAFEYYHALSEQMISHATPTMLNAGTIVPQLSSCFQLATGDDLPQLFDSVKSAAIISKWSGGVSMWLHNLRANNSIIAKTGGRSSGIKRYIKILNEVQLYVDQGGNRPGAFAMYLSVDHDDIFTFLSMGRIKGEEAFKSLNAPDLKYAMWVPDLFMEALNEQLMDPSNPDAGIWYLFSPDEAPGLNLVYGEEYRKLYSKYVDEKRYRRCVRAGDIIKEAFKTWTQSGTPYVLFKDAINEKSNMKNVAPICSSNLCAEVIIPSWSESEVSNFVVFNKDNIAAETGVCNLAAICLGSFIKDGVIDFQKIIKAATLAVRALDKVIDLTKYPDAACQRSNERHRPVGVGIMGLADVLVQLRLPYGSPESIKVARSIAAAVYFGAMTESARLAQEYGPYKSFQDSPASKGLLQPDLWNYSYEIHTNYAISEEDWAQLRLKVAKGIRNSYVVAYMPTATTSNIVGQNECFEPFTSTMYVRKTLAGEFMMVNKYLMRELISRKLWSEKTRKDIILAGGSIQNIRKIPQDIKDIYRTAREIHPSATIAIASSMAPFVCQSMSMNLFLTEPNLPRILTFLMEGWKAGLKTGMYYCHMQPIVGSQKTSCTDTCTSCAL